MDEKIFLVGFMGSGKSRFGRRLAIQLDRDFVDTDREIERLAAARIPEIFEKKGEEWFREMEKRVVDHLPNLGPGTVVALGGGAACRDGVMEMLNDSGLTVYLKMSPERIVARLDEKGRDKRPKIKGMDDEQLLAYINKILPEREKHYNKAIFVLDCDALADEQIVGHLLSLIQDSKFRIQS